MHHLDNRRQHFMCIPQLKIAIKAVAHVMVHSATAST